ncbi:TonB dependent receptor [Salinimicrobium catena]|uniref:TonB dependent receptor n=1 Tax=Salinimicrobium catena TaxID=390640 RepID=A0A1H5NQ79_9FLAO|nr:TonB-dependent receptor [Salinimicrobium catena]SDL54859.1 TonB dependent receptor [Salinimicrobium catena]SEF03755.1 TonB dependent receptor [Salinimicrobium catena]
MKIRSFAYILFFFFTGLLSAQEIKSDSIVVVKPYTPSVSDAYKIKEKPAITDSIDLEKKKVEYSIFSVPVASTFSPAKGRAAGLERERPPKVYENYFTLGFGTYTSVLAEFYSNLEVNRTNNFGIFLTHNSAQGDIEDVVLDDHYYDTELNLNYSSRQRNLTWNTDFGVEHQLFNWYGVEPSVATASPGIDPLHNYYSVYAGGEINLEDSFFDRAEAKYRYFGDDYSSVEHRFTVKPTLELPIGGELFHTNFHLDYVNGSFDRAFFTEEGLNYSFFNLGLDSSLLILRDDLTLNLGAAVFYSMDTENSDGSVFVYPKVTASYRMAGEYFIAYGGLEGGLKQNSYYNFTQKNPFVAPTLVVQPTDQQTNAYVGAKGKLSNSVGFNIKGSYISEDMKPLFKAYPQYTVNNDEDYAHGNSFGVVYDKVKTVSAFGELNFDVNRSFNLRLNGEYFVYDTDVEAEAWNLPDFKANLLADYQITENWFAGANAFFVGERKDEVSFDNGGPSVLPVNPEVVTLDSYFDLNLNLGYRFNDQLSIFAKGNNLFGDNYQKWMGYPVMGLQVMAGATYKFDFGRR